MKELKKLTATDSKLQAYREDKYDWIDMGDSYRIFQRPNLQRFLSFVFKHFRVSVWTAASKEYAIFIIENILLRGYVDRRIDYVFFSHHCRTKLKSCRKKVNNYKNLLLLNSEFGLAYDLNKTFILDDNANVYKIQPSNCIHVKSFDIENETVDKTDDQLISAIMPKLVELNSRFDV